MQPIGDPGDGVHAFLGEAILFSIVILTASVSVRLWRGRNQPTAARTKSRGLAGFLAVSAFLAGMGATFHARSVYYLVHARTVFLQERWSEARLSFEKSARNWRTADALGGQGVCSLLLDEEALGLKLMEEAAAARGGANSGFENFYRGYYYLKHGDWAQAGVFLSNACADGGEQFRSRSARLLAAMAIENGKPDVAAAFMKHFSSGRITEWDHAFVAAALKLEEGNASDASAILKDFRCEKVPVFWQSRFENLRRVAQGFPPAERTGNH
jgi:hypothetical protein